MTRRITAAFLGVLFLVLVAIVVPLGILDTHRLRSDFLHAATTTANAVAGVAEERLDDRSLDPRLRGVLTGAAQADDHVVVLDRSGRTVAALGGSVQPADDRLVVRVPVGSADHHVGTVILSRDEGPVESRIGRLWLFLAAAAVLALLVGAVAARLLG